MTAIVSGTYAWDVRDNMPVPLTRPYLDGVSFGDLRQLELALTPHGALRAGLAATDATAITVPIVGASDFGLSQFGWKVTIVSFSLLGKYTMNVTINDQNLVELVDTWFPNPVYGDMDYEMRYTQYKDFCGVKFPTLFHVHQGDPRLNSAQGTNPAECRSLLTIDARRPAARDADARPEDALSEHAQAEARRGAARPDSRACGDQ